MAGASWPGYTVKRFVAVKARQKQSDHGIGSLAARKAVPKAVVKHVPWYGDIHAIADKLVPGMADAFTQAVQAAKARIGASQWLAMAIAGKPDPGKLDDLTETLASVLTPHLERDYKTAVAQAGQETINSLMALAAGRTFAEPSGTISGMFDLENEASTAFARDRSSELVTAVTDDVKANIRDILGRSFEGDYDVRQTARLIEATVGLTPRQANAVETFYRNLTLEEKYPFDKMGKMADDYANRLLRQRATTIARTETIRSSNFGVSEGFRQARGSGLIGDDMERTWIVTPDDMLCPECAALDGTTAPIDGEFDDGGGDGPPLHPRCRCAVGLVDAKPGAASVAMPEEDVATAGAGDEETVIDDEVNSVDAGNTTDTALAWSNELDPDVVTSLKNYSENAYSSINTGLRGNRPMSDFDQGIIDNVDKAIAAYRNNEEVVLYRGIGSSMLQFVDGKPSMLSLSSGTILTDKAFVSTTTDKNFAASWAEKGQGERAAVIAINVPPGTNMAPMHLISEHPEESEILLGRGGSIKITGADQQVINGRTITVFKAEYSVG